MAITSPPPVHRPLTVRAHLATALASMAFVLAIGTWISVARVRECVYDTVETTCEPLPPAVSMLVGLGLTSAAALFLGAVVLWAPLRLRVSDEGH